MIAFWSHHSFSTLVDSMFHSSLYFCTFPLPYTYPYKHTLSFFLSLYLSFFFHLVSHACCALTMFLSLTYSLSLIFSPLALNRAALHKNRSALVQAHHTQHKQWHQQTSHLPALSCHWRAFFKHTVTHVTKPGHTHTGLTVLCFCASCAGCSPSLWAGQHSHCPLITLA